MALAGAGGFLAGVLLIAILGGAQPVYKERTLTVARPAQGSAVPALVGQRLDVALDKLEALGLKGDVQGGGLFGIADETRLEGRPPGSLARRAPAARATPCASTSTGHDARAAARPRRHAHRRGARGGGGLRGDGARGGRAPAARPGARWRSTPARGRARSGARRRRLRVLPAHRHQLVGGRCSAATRATATSCARCARGRRGTAARPGARALADQGVEDGELAAELGERFGADRRARHETFADAAPALDALRADHALALVTNGASCWQREKLAASGLADRFDVVVVSGELGTAKPDPVVYAHALSALGAEPGDAVMVGDSLRNDVDGPLAAGLRAVWLNRDGGRGRRIAPDLVEVADLDAPCPRSLAALA